MDLKQLKYFARIVELESITAAAQTLYVSQPSLSQHVANLESELGTKLLHRGAHGARPTPAGELLYNYAKTILRQVHEAAVAVRQESSDPAGQVSLGLPTSTSSILSVDLLTELTTSHRQILLEIVEGGTSHLAEMVARQRLDLTIAMDVQDSTKFDMYPLLNEELLLVGPASSAAPATMRLEDLCELPLVIPSFPNSVRVRIEGVCAERGLNYRVIAESSAASVMASAARAGLAWTILPWSAVRDDASLSLHRLDIEGRPLNRTLFLCVSKAAASNPACGLVRQLLTRLIERKVADGEWLYAMPVADRV
jgi:LysR family nitrogen assimilation transcriptional regulator